jgi:uncharacterized membrane protein
MGEDHIREKLTLGQRAADRVTGVVGSWRFLIIQSFILLVWIILNVVAYAKHWDPYPFILLNLILSFQAAFTAPVILMSENRTAERDRKKSAIDLSTDRKAEREIEQIQAYLKKIDEDKLDKILAILKSDK